jgi:hypothetical protein
VSLSALLLKATLTSSYILLVPVNLLRLALPITQCLTYVPAALLALEALDRGNSSMDQENVKLLLSYFVVLGLIQFTESLIPGVLEKRIRKSHLSLIKASH